MWEGEEARMTGRGCWGWVKRENVHRSKVEAVATVVLAVLINL